MAATLVIGFILVLALGGFLFIFCCGELGDRYDRKGGEKEQGRNRPDNNIR